MNPVRKSLTVASNVYQQIKIDIISGKWTPGYKLKLEKLKEKYKVSLSTLREILNRLTSEGFVSAEEQCGFFVTPISDQDMIEITEIRILLECSALKTSIENGDIDWESDIVAAYHRLQVAEKAMLSGDVSKKAIWKRYDWEFHLALIKACNSNNLLGIHSIIYDKYLRYQMLVLTYRGQAAADEHREIFESVLARDAKKSVEILEVHIQEGLNHTLLALKNQDSDIKNKLVKNLK